MGPFKCFHWSAIPYGACILYITSLNRILLINLMCFALFGNFRVELQYKCLSLTVGLPTQGVGVCLTPLNQEKLALGYVKIHCTFVQPLKTLWLLKKGRNMVLMLNACYILIETWPNNYIRSKCSLMDEKLQIRLQKTVSLSFICVYSESLNNVL